MRAEQGVGIQVVRFEVLEHGGRAVDHAQLKQRLARFLQKRHLRRINGLGGGVSFRGSHTFASSMAKHASLSV